MFNHLPDLVDPLRLVDRQSRFRSKISLIGMDRLKEFLVDENGVAEFELSFEKQGEYSSVVGFVKSNLILACQVCLQDLSWTVHSKINLAIVSSIDEANLLSDTFEPLLLQEQTIAIKSIIEDELILAIPIIPKHENCRLQSSHIREHTQENPFAILRQLKDQGEP